MAEAAKHLLTKVAQKAHLTSSTGPADAAIDSEELTTTRVDAVNWQPKKPGPRSLDDGNSDEDDGIASSDFVEAHEDVDDKDKRSESRSSSRHASGASTPVPAVKANETALRITAGPDYDKSRQKLVQVNGAASDISDQVKVAVRIRDYTGLPSDSPKSCRCFDSSKDTFAIAWSITPSEDINAKDLLFGVDTGQNPIKKFGISTSLVNRAFEIIKHFIDNSLSCDVSAEKPWMMGPAVRSATMNINIGEKHTSGDWSAPDEAGVIEGGSGEGQQERERMSWPSSADKRRKYLADDSKLAATILEKGRTYSFEFGNGYIDWKDVGGCLH